MTYKNFFLHYISGAVFTVMLLILGVVIPQDVESQPVLGARNTSLGGGGTAYLTGLEATLWNPANLMVRDRPGRWHLSVGHTAILHEPVLSSDIAGDQFFNFTDTYFPHRPNSANITDRQRSRILDNNYPSNSLISQHQTRADAILGGIHWQRESEAFSLVARARFGSRVTIGRGWYSEEFIDSGDAQVRDFTLNQQRNHLYEVAFGYAREFTFINGLFPQINKLHVGITPKFILAGPNMNLQYEAQYIRNDGTNERFINNFSYQSSGSFSQAILSYRSGADSRQIIRNNFDRSLQLDHTGYGAGVDFGLTYLIPLGDDFSTISGDREKAITSKSIRIALSVNDIGMIHYNKHPLQMESPMDTAATNDQQSPVSSMFIGSEGQFLSYFDDANTLPNPLKGNQNPDSESYEALLPTSMNAGVLVEYSRIKLMADLTLGLNNTAFTTTKLAVHLGLETYPIKQIPIRFGTRFATGLPARLGIGTGIEMKHWDITFGSQVLIRSRTFTSEIAGGAFGGIQLHL